MTPFQTKCISASKNLLESDFGLSDVAFAEIIGKRETYYKFVFAQSGHVIEVYIYLDEAGFMIDGHDWTICERPDYSTDEELIISFIAKLKNVIHSFIPPARGL